MRTKMWFGTTRSLAMVAALTLLVSCLLGVSVTWAAPGLALPAAQIADVTGPGQAVPVPAPQCPSTAACQYAERNFLPNGYRVQALQVCGANCTTQYWVSTMDGTLLLALDPVRGGGILAVGRATVDDPHPAVRTVMPVYQEGDPACCPSLLADTTYRWDTSTSTLQAGEPSMIPAENFVGWDAFRDFLTTDGYFDVFRGL
jgi:hypothetical protein